MRKNSPAPQILISKESCQYHLLKKVQEELEHQGIEETYQQIVSRFWWPSLKKKVKLWIYSCEACQKQHPLVPREIQNPTSSSNPFGKVALDACHIKAGQYKYLMVAKDNLSGWVEAAPLVKLTASNLAKFLLEYWVYQYGSIKTVTTDNSVEFKE